MHFTFRAPGHPGQPTSGAYPPDPNFRSMQRSSSTLATALQPYYSSATAGAKTHGT